LLQESGGLGRVTNRGEEKLPLTCPQPRLVRRLKRGLQRLLVERVGVCEWISQCIPPWGAQHWTPQSLPRLRPWRVVFSCRAAHHPQRARRAQGVRVAGTRGATPRTLQTLRQAQSVKGRRAVHLQLREAVWLWALQRASRGVR
jgi:hypothetical protein